MPIMAWRRTYRWGMRSAPCKPTRIGFEYPVDELVPGEVSYNPFPCHLAYPNAKVRVFQAACYRRDQCLRVSGRHDQTAGPVLDECRRFADIGSHHRDSGCHQFKQFDRTLGSVQSAVVKWVDGYITGARDESELSRIDPTELDDSVVAVQLPRAGEQCGLGFAARGTTRDDEPA